MGYEWSKIGGTVIMIRGYNRHLFVKLKSLIVSPFVKYMKRLLLLCFFLFFLLFWNFVKDMCGRGNHASVSFHQYIVL